PVSAGAQRESFFAEILPCASAPFYNQRHIQRNSLAASFCNGGWHIFTCSALGRLDENRKERFQTTEFRKRNLLSFGTKCCMVIRLVCRGDAGFIPKRSLRFRGARADCNSRST